MPFFFFSGEDIVKDVMPHMVLDHNGSFSLIPSFCKLAVIILFICWTGVGVILFA
jgi:hypothetical protein